MHSWNETYRIYGYDQRDVKKSKAIQNKYHDIYKPHERVPNGQNFVDSFHISSVFCILFILLDRLKRKKDSRKKNDGIIKSNVL